MLDLTATPKKESNIISYVDAMQLKNEHMVKLPVFVYNRDSQSEVLIDAIDLRNKLEEIADAEYAKTGKYIRPIAVSYTHLGQKCGGHPDRRLAS